MGYEGVSCPYPQPWRSLRGRLFQKFLEEYGYGLGPTLIPEA